MHSSALNPKKRVRCFVMANVVGFAVAIGFILAGHTAGEVDQTSPENPVKVPSVTIVQQSPDFGKKAALSTYSHLWRAKFCIETSLPLPASESIPYG